MFISRKRFMFFCRWDQKKYEEPKNEVQISLRYSYGKFSAVNDYYVKFRASPPTQTQGDSSHRNSGLYCTIVAGALALDLPAPLVPRICFQNLEFAGPAAFAVHIFSVACRTSAPNTSDSGSSQDPRPRLSGNRFLVRGSIREGYIGGLCLFPTYIR